MKTVEIVSTKYLGKYKIRLEFNDGKTQDVDFESFLMNAKHPEMKKYLELDKFQSFQVRDGDLDWNDFDMCFPIWDLYNNSINKKVSNNENEEAS